MEASSGDAVCLSQHPRSGCFFSTFGLPRCNEQQVPGAMTPGVFSSGSPNMMVFLWVPPKATRKRYLQKSRRRATQAHSKTQQHRNPPMRKLDEFPWAGVVFPGGKSREPRISDCPLNLLRVGVGYVFGIITQFRRRSANGMFVDLLEGSNCAQITTKGALGLGGSQAVPTGNGFKLLGFASLRRASFAGPSIRSGLEVRAYAWGVGIPKRNSYSDHIAIVVRAPPQKRGGPPPIKRN